MPTNADGTFDVDSTGSSFGGLLQAVLGKSVDQETDSTQTTAATTGTTGSTTGSANTSQVNSGSTTGSQTNTGATSGSQVSTGATAGSQVNAGATTGSQSSTGTQSSTGSQNTSGTTNTTGTQSTTGTVDTSGSNSVTGTTTQQSSADLTALQSVYDRQSAGITPEMLAAIFREGSKAAPQLVTANSNALGARTSDNSPVAQVLRQLQGDLVSKAADMNRQLLSDAGNTAGKIADLTKSVTGTTDSDTVSLSTQVQDLVTSTDSTAIVNQIVATLNNQATTGTQNSSGTSSGTQSNTGTSSGTQNNTGTSSGTQNTAGTSTGTQTGTQTTAGTSASTGTQNQTVTANEDKTTNTTINTSSARSLLGMAAAGVGLAALYRAATGGGFTGAVGDFVNWLKGQGAQVGQDGTVVVTPVTGGDPITGVDLPALDELVGPTIPDDLYDWERFGTPQGFADGGQVPFLPIDMLIKKQTVVGNPDADLNSLMQGLTGGDGTGTGSGSGVGTGGTSGAAPVTDVNAGGVGTDASPATGSVGFTINDAGIAVPDRVNVSGLQAILGALGLLGVGIPGLTPAVTQIANASNTANTAAAASANVAMQDSNQGINGAMPGAGPTATAGPAGTGGIAANAAEAAAAAATAAGHTDAAIAAASQAAANATLGGATPSGAATAGAAAASAVSATAAPAPAAPLSIADMIAQNAAAIRSDPSFTSTATTDDVDSVTSSVAPAAAPAAAVDADADVDAGIAPGNGTGDADSMGFGGEYADGGMVDDTDSIAEALGLAVSSNAKIMKMMLSHIQKPAKTPGYANGGKPKGYADGKMVGNQIRGPGTGISDSINAVGPQGQPIKVANKEVIIPADVVEKFGVEAFNKLIAQHHVPAEMQEAITGG